MPANHLSMGPMARGGQELRKAQEACKAAGRDPDSLAVLPFLDEEEPITGGGMNHGR